MFKRSSTKASFSRSINLVSAVALTLAPTLGHATGESINWKADGWDLNPNLPSSCQTVQDDLIERNFSQFTHSLVTCMASSPEDQALQQSMLGLLSQAYMMTAGRLDSEFQLPDEILDLDISSNLRSDGDGSKIKISARPLEGHFVREFALLSASGETLLEFGSPTSEVERESDGTLVVVRRFGTPVPDGLFWLKLGIDDKPTQTIGVPISDWQATSFPQFEAPVNGERIVGGNPRFKWTAMPPPIPSFSKHWVYAAAFTSEAPDFDWVQQWESKGLNWNDTSIVVGDQQLGSGVTTLRKGRYAAYLLMAEERTFGGISIGRRSSTKVTFFVE